MPAYVINQIWRTLTGSRWDITYISARIHNNEIPAATPMFPGSDNRYDQLGMLCVAMSGYIIKQRWRPLTGSR